MSTRKKLSALTNQGERCFTIQFGELIYNRSNLLSETRSRGEVELIVQNPCAYMDRRAGPLSEISLAKGKRAQRHKTEYTAS